MGKKIAGMLVLGAVLAAGTTAANGASILEWNTAGNTGSETTEASSFAATNISAANLTLGAGVSPAANGNRFGGNNWFDTGDAQPPTLANSIAGNDYIQFIVTPGVGYSFTATGFNFIWDRSNTGPDSVALRSSADGYAADLASAANIASSQTNFTNLVFNLANVTTATTFRLYGYDVGSGTAGTGGTAGFDTLTGVTTPNVLLVGTVQPLSGGTPTISLSNGAVSGFDNIASGGQVDLIVDANTIVESEIDGLTSNESKGAAVLSPLPPSTMSKVYVLLWLDDTDTGNATSIADLVDALDGDLMISDDGNGADDDDIALSAKWDLFQSGIYAGFNVLVEFDSPGAFDRVNWDFIGFTDIEVDQIAVVPEPASLGVLALGGLALLGRRRK